MDNDQERKDLTKSSQSLNSFSNLSKYFNLLSPWYKITEMMDNSWWVDSQDTSNTNLFRYSSYDIPPTLLRSSSSIVPQSYNNLSIEDTTNKDSYKKKNSSNDKEIEKQDSFLEENYNLYRYKVIPDGNCLYRALAKSLCNDQNQHMIVRKEIFKFIRNNFQRFKGYIEGDPEIYLNEAIKENVWGGYLEILATTELFDINIIIVIGGSSGSKSKVRVTCHHFSGEIVPKETIWLSWLSAGHYDLVVDYKPDNEVYNKWLSQREMSSIADEQLANQLADEDKYQEEPGTSNSFVEDERLAHLLQLEENEKRY